jgi:diacylglycerol kinase family enzyme
MKWLAIVNPTAGRAHEAGRLLARLGELKGVDAEIAHTSVPGDATRLARDATGFDGVIAIGGDGTIAEVLQGMDLDRQRLAVLPAGHGNCLARDLGVIDAAQALTALQRCYCRNLDLMETRIEFANGRVERRFCGSTLAVGYVTDVVTCGRQRLSGLGHAAYAAATMIVNPKPFQACLSVEDGAGQPRRYTGIVINNTAHLANFRAFPDASAHDGLLDVMEQDYRWPRQLLHNVAVLAGSRAFGAKVMHQAAAVRLELGAPQTLMADGELLHEVTKVAVRCRPAAVSCVVRSA